MGSKCPAATERRLQPAGAGRHTRSLAQLLGLASCPAQPGGLHSDTEQPQSPAYSKAQLQRPTNSPTQPWSSAPALPDCGAQTVASSRQNPDSEPGKPQNIGCSPTQPRTIDNSSIQPQSTSLTPPKCGVQMEVPCDKRTQPTTMPKTKHSQWPTRPQPSQSIA